MTESAGFAPTPSLQILLHPLSYIAHPAALAFTLHLHSSATCQHLHHLLHLLELVEQGVDILHGRTASPGDSSPAAAVYYFWTLPLHLGHRADYCFYVAQIFLFHL